MIIVKIIYFLLIIIPPILLGKIIFSFVKSIIDHKKRMSKLNEWTEFNKKIIEWSGEIQDPFIKQEYLQFCMNRIFDSKKLTIDSISSGNETTKLKSELVSRYLNHVPSLKQEIREEKLNKILKYGR